MTRLLLALSLLVAGCGGLPLYEARLGGRIHVRILSQADVQSACAQRGVGLPLALAYPLMTPLLGCTIGYEDGRIEVFSTSWAPALAHELDHAINNKRCHDLLGRPAICR